MQKIWFITGASRGLGLEIAQAALRAGDRVVATARDRRHVNARLGPDSAQLLTVDLDVSRADQVQAAVDAALAKFGTIDVLVNNAGYGHLGYFEELTREEIATQFATNVFGLFDVTRAVLPSMRAARRGRIFNISSAAGIRGSEFASLYCASKFAIEGFSESLAQELAPFGVFVTLVEPGPFRTDFLSRDSMQLASVAVADYDARRGDLRAAFEQRNGKQPGDPLKLAEAIVRLSAESQPPLRFVAGRMALDAADAKLAGMAREIEQWREVSIATDFETAELTTAARANAGQPTSDSALERWSA